MLDRVVSSAEVELGVSATADVRRDDERMDEPSSQIIAPQSDSRVATSRDIVSFAHTLTDAAKHKVTDAAQSLKEPLTLLDRLRARNWEHFNLCNAVCIVLLIITPIWGVGALSEVHDIPQYDYLKGPVETGSSLNFCTCCYMAVVFLINLLYRSSLIRAKIVARTYFSAATEEDRALGVPHAKFELALKDLRSMSWTENVRYILILLYFFEVQAVIHTAQGKQRGDVPANPYNGTERSAGEWVIYAFAVGLGSLALLALLFFSFRNLRIGIFRREREGTHAYVTRRIWDANVVAWTQFCATVFVGTMAFSLPLITQPIVDQTLPWRGGSWSKTPGVCHGINQTYVDVHACTQEYAKIPFGTWTSTPFLHCDDGGVTVYTSQYVACQVAHLGQSYGTRAWAGIWGTFYLFLVLPYIDCVRAIDEDLTWANWHDKGRAFVWQSVFYACLGLAVAPILLVTLLQSGPGHQYIYHLMVIGGFSWLAAFIGIAAEYLMQRVPGYARGHKFELKTKGAIQSVQLKIEVEKLVQKEVLRTNTTTCRYDGRFAGSANTLKTADVARAALGLREYMKVGKEWQLPSYNDGVDKIREEFEKNGTDLDRECLTYILEAEAGSCDRVFENGNLKMDCDQDGNVLRDRLILTHGEGGKTTERGMRLKDFCECSTATLGKLSGPHVVGLRAYSTHCFKSLNTKLRQDGTWEDGTYPFPVTMTFIDQAIKQLRAVRRDEVDASGDHGRLDLWRGMKDLNVKDDFLEKGGTEVACMSTTTDLKIAVQYSLSSSALLFKLLTKSCMDRGADISWVSAFPNEAEILFPPLTYLRATGKSEEINVDVKVTVQEPPRLSESPPRGRPSRTTRTTRGSRATSGETVHNKRIKVTVVEVRPSMS